LVVTDAFCRAPFRNQAGPNTAPPNWPYRSSFNEDGSYLPLVRVVPALQHALRLVFSYATRGGWTTTKGTDHVSARPAIEPGRTLVRAPAPHDDGHSSCRGPDLRASSSQLRRSPSWLVAAYVPLFTARQTPVLQTHVNIPICANGHDGKRRRDIPPTGGRAADGSARSSAVTSRARCPIRTGWPKA